MFVCVRTKYNAQLVFNNFHSLFADVNPIMARAPLYTKLDVYIIIIIRLSPRRVLTLI